MRRAALILTSVLSMAATDAPAAPARITVDVHGADLHNVFRLLAEVGQVNIAVSPEVKGRVTMKLRGVDWREVLAAVLDQHQLGMERRGSVITIDTLERITARAELKARTAAARQLAASLRTVLIPVSYAEASALVPIAKSMLSPRGTVAVDKRTNTLIVTDVDPERIQDTLR